MSLYVNLSFLELLESILLDSVRDLINALGVGGFLIFITLVGAYRTYITYQNFQLKKLESKANIDLLNAQTAAQLKLAEHQADTETSSRRDKMLELAINNSATVNQLLSRMIDTSNSINELLRSVQTQTTNNTNTLTTYFDTTEAYQTKMAVTASQIHDNSLLTKQIVESLPAKLDGGFEQVMKRLAAIGQTADQQHAALKASILQVAVDVASAVATVKPMTQPEHGTVQETPEPSEKSGAADAIT